MWEGETVLLPISWSRQDAVSVISDSVLLLQGHAPLQGHKSCSISLFFVHLSSPDKPLCAGSKARRSAQALGSRVGILIKKESS